MPKRSPHLEEVFLGEHDCVGFVEGGVDKGHWLLIESSAGGRTRKGEIREIGVGWEISRDWGSWEMNEMGKGDCGEMQISRGRGAVAMRRREGARSLRDGARWNGLDGRKFWMGRVGGRELVRGRPCAESRAVCNEGMGFFVKRFLHACGD